MDAPELWLFSTDDLPAACGAYALLIALPRPLRLPAPRFDATLPGGRYVYVGNANNRGGIRARCRHHFKPAKAARWHIDHLTMTARRIRAIGVPDQTECALMARLLYLPGVEVPVPGFGSSDCRTCSSHLAAIGNSLSPQHIARQLRQLVDLSAA